MFDGMSTSKDVCVRSPTFESSNRLGSRPPSTEEEDMSVQKLAQQKLRTAIFAANRSVWISSCEACLFLETGGAAVKSHPDVAVHGRKGLFMMSECKRILNKEVGGEGLWQTDLSKCQGQQEGEVLEINPGGEETPSQDKRSDKDDKDDEVEDLRVPTEHSDVEENDTDAEADVKMSGTQANERTQCD